ncbi:MAG: dihydroneopterin aldolase [Flavobacteriaceae bacterium CG_4_8_14_3_um_filter_34_10]|nr:dihydroneopterin aldolase [Flavobacteriia bacterium]OIP52109.1 MAG: dihydroneopterin aldolase [Flavobacteriaceae bacterium CG2_30_34_30]PIQ19348.1 MAG: dihydroneopterin aldolase [Flavobacteriaceae bacterium CG18_big_fil_WC_8_21_14_2_50_34_36]PIV49186.1 MAG: dihydroneopterin aldolase [Flavobacteriaceae bacterium CG02_land_8_20_14_3_00_34_13]PIX09686.1 MAG: dihydroneopterin aldolase [Flavobacteriaceae bacterium CG_4_8_14_3_um_filter_34_10]PIZ08618.1 MAG: dihydroneopterin aldolase [Flavobacter
MGSIRLKKVKIYAFHGCLVEEGQIGSEYFVNLKVKASLAEAATTDALKDTVDYVHLNRIIKEEMAIRSKLLEHVGKRIISRIFNELILVNVIKVGISKVNPPIGGNVAEVVVIMKAKR